jgi:two-component system chemotaxis sensor kinase CheA
VRQGEKAADAAGKDVRIVVTGEAVVLDTGIIEQIVDPLFHLLQNAIVHGIETAEERRAVGKSAAGTITLTATYRGAFVIIEVADDGRGIDAEFLRKQAVAQGFLGADVAAALSDGEALDLMFLPGFSTASAVTTAAGRGVGMDVVHTNVGRLNGQVEVHTELGAGSRFTLKLPVSLIISEALTLRTGDERFAIPVNAVRRVATLPAADVRAAAHGETVVVEDEPVALIRLDRALGLPSPTRRAHVEAVLVHAGNRVIALEVDEVVQKEEIVIKSLGRFLEGVGPFAGATVSPDGQVTLLLDPVKLLDVATRSALAKRPPAAPAPAAVRPRRAIAACSSSTTPSASGDSWDRCSSGRASR